jgi:hypothetical protein
MCCRGQSRRAGAPRCAPPTTRSGRPELAAEYREAYDYYPQQWVSPYIDRRRENGWGLYGLLGIGKGDKDKMHAQHQRNYRFFDAPVGLMFTIDRVMGRARWWTTACSCRTSWWPARARACTPVRRQRGTALRIILPHIGAGADEMLVCGMALGYADESG